MIKALLKIISISIILIILNSNVNAGYFYVLKTANIRSGPGLDHEIVGKAYKGDVIKNAEREINDWIHFTVKCVDKNSIKKACYAPFAYPKSLIKGEIYTFEIRKDGRYMEPVEGMFIDFTGEKIETRVPGRFCWEILYHPMEIKERFIHSSLGIFGREYHIIEEKKRIKEIRNKNWPENMKKLVRQGRIRIGMNAEMVKLSWGDPNSINRTVTAYGVHEQWIYWDKYYLYFDDNILTSWQEMGR